MCYFSHIPGLYEMLRYAINKFYINLVVKIARNLKEIIHNKIDPIPNYEIADIIIITLVTETNDKKIYIRVTWTEVNYKLKE